MRLMLLLSLLVAEAAWASCVQFSCFCLRTFSAPSTSGTLEAEITAIDGARTDFKIQAVRGTEPAFTNHTLISVPREQDDQVGGKWLLFVAEGTYRSRMKQDVNGKVTCEYSDTPTAMDADLVTRLFATPDCTSALAQAGYQQACHDVGGCGCSSFDAAFPAMLLAALWLRRRAA